MKQLSITLFGILVWFHSIAQKELHIHHINIENGDATMIGIFDVPTQSYTAKILIDGGQSNPDQYLLPYIKKMSGTDASSSHFNYVILTHFHDDHYTGLLALADGRITADSIVDPGRYRVDSVFLGGIHKYPEPIPGNLVLPVKWNNALYEAAHATPVPFVKGRSNILVSFGATKKTSIGRTIRLGMIGQNAVELQCVAGWGNSLSSGGGLVSNPNPDLTNANDYTLAFIVSCGEFRYFIGGDLGGQNHGDYIDQETALTQYFTSKYPGSYSWLKKVQKSGHICGFKANHHGSNNSNTTNFMQSMTPALTITSAGNKSSWHLPNPAYLTRLAAIKPLSVWTDHEDSIYNRGIYFTNLYNFNTDFPELDDANGLFKNKSRVSYDYGNDSETTKASYLIKVRDNGHLGQKSSFETGRVDITDPTPYKRLAVFYCHTK